MADVVIGEPGALIGFSAVRAIEQVEGGSLPEGAHTAEFYLQHGTIDQIVDRTHLKESLSTLLDLLTSRYKLVLTAPVARMKPRRSGPAWDKVQLARHSGRPTAREYINRLARSFIELRGDRQSGEDGVVIGGFAEIDGEAVVVIGHQREVIDGQPAGPAWVRPSGFRKARRLMRAAEKFKLPVITFVDTAGAYPGLEAEAQGIGTAVANCLATMSELKTPTLAVIIGEGGSEGALAFSLADRVLMLENATYSVVPPERASSILYRTEARAEDIADSLHLTAHDCLRLKVADTIVPEPDGGAHENHEEAARLLKLHLLTELSRVQKTRVPTLVKQRFERYRHFGKYSHGFRAGYERRMRESRERLQRFPGRVRQRMLRLLPRRPIPTPGDEEADGVLIP
jgi:acetyl-CoA carboxylase carboxyl transferase subunit beta